MKFILLSAEIALVENLVQKFVIFAMTCFEYHCFALSINKLSPRRQLHKRGRIMAFNRYLPHFCFLVLNKFSLIRLSVNSFLRCN